MLINCTVYRQGKKVAEIEQAAISHYVAQPGCFVWVALQDPGEAELREFQTELDLPELAVEDAFHGHQRPKLEEYADCLFAVLHLVEADEQGELSVGELAVFAGRNFVLSVRNRSTKGFLGVRARAEREPELLQHGTGYVLYALMDAVVDRYFPLLEQLESELEELEAVIFSETTPGRASVERLYLLKQKSSTLKHALAPLQHELGRLYGGRVPVQVTGVQDHIRDVADHVARLNAGVDNLRDTIATAIQVNLSLVTIDDGAVTKRLAAWASIFGVWTALAGIWGMNFKFMPELEWRYGYAVGLGIIAVSCGALFLRFRRIGWL
jgi:magnesium transporter